MSQLNRKQKKIVSIMLAVFFMGVISLTFAAQLLSNSVEQSLIVKGLADSVELTIDTPFDTSDLWQAGSKSTVIQIDFINPDTPWFLYIINVTYMDNVSEMLTSSDLQVIATGYSDDHSTQIWTGNTDDGVQPGITIDWSTGSLLMTLTQHVDISTAYPLGYGFDDIEVVFKSNCPTGNYQVSVQVEAE